MRSKKKVFLKRKNNLAMFVIFIFLIGVLFGIKFVMFKKTVKLENEKTITIYSPAIDNKGGGILVNLTTSVRNGKGLVLVNINKVYSDLELQRSSRQAVKATADYLDVKLDNIDVTYSIKTNADIVGGGSAGAAMALSTISLLSDIELRNDVMITGTINESGDIGKIGGVKEKIKASKGKAEIFLLPKGQSNEIKNYKSKMFCEMINEIEYCRTQYVEGETEIDGIKVIEVGNLEGALRYFKK